MSENNAKFEFNVQDFITIILGFVFGVASINAFVLQKQTFTIFIFQMMLASVLFLSFYTDKYIQFITIFTSLLYIASYWYMKNYLIMENISSMYDYFSVMMTANVIITILIFVFCGLIISSWLFFEDRIILGATITLLAYCILISIFCTFLYFERVLPQVSINFLNGKFIANFYIICFQFYSVLFVFFTFIYSIIMSISYSIHIKMIPNIKSMGGNI